MFGPPKDVEGKCNARLFLADDYGDNHCTILCGLGVAHKDMHQEKFTRPSCGRVAIQWEKAEKNDL